MKKITLHIWEHTFNPIAIRNLIMPLMPMCMPMPELR